MSTTLLPRPARRPIVASWRVPDASAIRLRPLTRDDFPLLVQWLAAPHVAMWWQEPVTSEWVEDEYGQHVDGDLSTEAFVIDLDGAPIGLIQRYRHADYPVWETAVGIEGAAGVDYLIGRKVLTGRGFGAEAIRQASRDAFLAYPEVQVVCAVTSQDNIASWRALEKAGFGRERAVEQIASDHPSDHGPSFVYVLARPR